MVLGLLDGPAVLEQQPSHQRSMVQSSCWNLIPKRDGWFLIGLSNRQLIGLQRPIYHSMTFPDAWLEGYNISIEYIKNENTGKPQCLSKQRKTLNKKSLFVCFLVMKYYRETETKYAYSQGDQNCHMRQKVNIGAARLFSQFSFRKGKEN